MENSASFSNQRSRLVIILSGIFAAIYLTINFFVIGGDGFVYSLNNNITIPLAIGTTLFAFSFWNLARTGRHSRLLWGGLLAGWGLWTIAEVLWVVYGYLYQDIPYPSPADFFWLVGYLPMGYGLYARIREIPIKPDQTQKVVLWITSVVTVLITTIFILVPIIQANDTSNFLESALNVIYPLVDLVLLIIVFRLAFVYTSGDYGFGWNLMVAGFILHSLSNLAFSYANLYDLYYPDLRVNFISGVATDAPYNLSYLLWFLSLYFLRLILSRQKPLDVIVQPTLVPNTSLLVFLRGDNTVISVSNNFSSVFGFDGEKEKYLESLLHISPQESKSILTKIQIEGKITDHLISIKDRFGSVREAYICGLAVLSPAGKYAGCNLVLRMLVDDDYGLDEKLTAEQKSIIAYVRIRSGSDERDRIRKLLLDYHLAYLKQLPD